MQWLPEALQCPLLYWILAQPFPLLLNSFWLLDSWLKLSKTVTSSSENWDVLCCLYLFSFHLEDNVVLRHSGAVPVLQPPCFALGVPWEWGGGGGTGGAVQGVTLWASLCWGTVFKQAAVGNALCAACKVENYCFTLQGGGYLRKDDGVIYPQHASCEVFCKRNQGVGCHWGYQGGFKEHEYFKGMAIKKEINYWKETRKQCHLTLQFASYLTLLILMLQLWKNFNLLLDILIAE